MTKIGHQKPFFCLFLFIFTLTFQAISATPDSPQYIGIDEIRPDMEAYCLTVLSGTKVEKFGLKILSIVRGAQPGQDMILVLGTDERFEHSSAIHGCSGSSVFIDGRLAGALAAGWDGSLDALYLVRPIEDMLKIGTGKDSGSGVGNDKMEYGFDFSKPLDIDAYYQQSIKWMQEQNESAQMYLPLSSTLPTRVIEQYASELKGMGFLPVGTGGLLPSRSFQEVGNYERGGILALVFCGGDISLAATGTVTEVIGDQVYGFGHSYRGQGVVNLPMATGIVHTVVASRKSSFKFSSPGPVTGTFRFDKSSGVRGTIGQMPQTIPLHIKVDRYNDTQSRVYNCYLAVDQMMTPLILQAVLDGTVKMQGNLPLDHTIQYSGRINIEGGESILVDNISSGNDTSDVIREFYSAVGLFLNNPFQKVRIDSVDVEMKVEPVNTTASIWSVGVSQTTVNPGDTITASVVLRSYRSEEEAAVIDIKIPETLRSGTYKLQIAGCSEYLSFISKLAPQRFRAVDLSSLTKSLNGIFEKRRDRLYAVMQVPASGVVMRQHELGQLPGTKMLLMQDSKRLQPLEPYNAWAENYVQTDQIISGDAGIEITVK